MVQYNPQAHVFSYGGTAPKEWRERHALEEFCKRMRTRHKASFSIVPIRDALSCGLVVNPEGSTVDGVLRTSRGMVAVELLGYSPLRDRGDMMARDLELRRGIKVALYDSLKAKPFSLSLGYRLECRPGPKHQVRRTVPRERDSIAVINELHAVVAAVPTLAFNHFLSVHFVKPELAERWGMRQGILYMDETRYPICAAHFSRVRFQGLKDGLPTRVDSELSGGAIGIDAEWVKEHVASKATKSLQKSRQRANGLPVWLIVHSDGCAIHQTIHETHRPRALELCRDVLAATEHAFTRVYWADRTGYLDAAWVGRVL